MKLKDWEAFQKYRDKRLKKVIDSKEYKEIYKRRNEALKVDTAHLDYYRFVYPLTETLLDAQENLLMMEVPENTVEGCLNWLVGRKKQ
ncbi:hypothetical protein LCGC14_0399090 [marine sediment metagenome]|uniref:Uncharacterized protein n=1 Tax=marine sediment metagenome TaxID=412755 RepID=A0A0F9W6C0_9ZZZZ|nr:hypothetical protein [Candidatus Aminicenantes bacterium]